MKKWYGIWNVRRKSILVWIYSCHFVILASLNTVNSVYIAYLMINYHKSNARSHLLGSCSNDVRFLSFFLFSVKDGKMGDRVATQQLMVVPRHRLSTVDAEHSLCTAPWSGTSCRTTSAHSRTMSPLDRVWKPGFSPDTSLFSTLEIFEVIALYKSTFTIPFAIPYHCVFHFPNENEMENNTRFSSVQVDWVQTSSALIQALY